MKKILTILFVFFSMYCYAQGAGYIYTRTITLSNTQATGTQSNFPVMICENFTLGNGNTCQTDTFSKTVSNGGKFQNVNGYDHIYSTNIGCTSPLPYEQDVNAYNPVTGSMIDWVQISGSVSLSNHLFYICYGNSSITTFQGGAIGAAWDSTFAAVYHSYEAGNPLCANQTVPSFMDSTSNNNVGGVIGSSSSCVVGQINGAFNVPSPGTVDNIGVANSASLMIPTNVTLSTWLNISGTSPNWNIAITKDGTISGVFNYNYALGIAGSGNGADVGKVYWLGGVQPITFIFSNAVLPQNQWHYVVITANELLGSNQICFYIDGTLDSCKNHSSTLDPTVTEELSMGNEDFGAGKELNGSEDEMRIVNVTRSASWITNDFNNQSSPTTYYAFGPQVGGNFATQIGGFLVGP